MQVSFEEQGAETAVEVEIAGKATAPFTVQVARPPGAPRRDDDGGRRKREGAVAVALSQSCRVSCRTKYRVTIRLITSFFDFQKFCHSIQGGAGVLTTWVGLT